MNDFTQGSITKKLISFAIPMLIGNIFQQMYSMVDALIVGRFVGGTALAAVGVSMSLLNFLLAVLIGLTTGASVVIAQLFGAKDYDRLTRTVSTSMVFLGVLALVISAVGIIGAPLFLRMMGAAPELQPDAVVYMRIVLAGIVFPVFYNMYTAYMRALGDSRRPLYFLIIATVLNTLLDLLFVALLDWGVAGAAIATIIAQAVSVLLCFFTASKGMPLLKVTRLHFDFTLFKLVLRYSVPAAIQLSTVSLAQLTIMRLINSFGYTAVAGYTAANKVDQFAMMPLDSVNMALANFVGQNMGAGLEDRAKKGLHSAMRLTVGLGIVLSAVAFLVGKSLIALFIDPGEADAAAILQAGNNYLSVIVLFYTLFAIFFSFNGFFRGAGDAVIVMALTITSLTIRTISAYILAHNFGMGPEAVAYSIPIGWGLCSLFAFIYYKKRLWAGKAVGKTSPPSPQAESEPGSE